MSKPALRADLSPDERSRLAELEAVVERGLQTFYDVGSALLEIRADRLYRKTHTTFEAYCRERFGFSGSRGRQLIAAAKTVTAVTLEGLPAPKSEREARELRRELRRWEQWADDWEAETGEPPCGLDEFRRLLREGADAFGFDLGELDREQLEAAHADWVLKRAGELMLIRGLKDVEPPPPPPGFKGVGAGGSRAAVSGEAARHLVWGFACSREAGEILLVHNALDGSEAGIQDAREVLRRLGDDEFAEEWDDDALVNWARGYVHGRVGVAA